MVNSIVFYCLLAFLSDDELLLLLLDELSSSTASNRNFTSDSSLSISDSSSRHLYCLISCTSDAAVTLVWGVKTSWLCHKDVLEFGLCWHHDCETLTVCTKIEHMLNLKLTFVNKACFPVTKTGHQKQTHSNARASTPGQSGWSRHSVSFRSLSPSFLCIIASVAASPKRLIISDFRNHFLLPIFLLLRDSVAWM